MDYFEWIPVETPVEAQTLPDISRRVLLMLAEEKRGILGRMLRRGFTEQDFERVWLRHAPLAFFHVTTDTAHFLSLHIRAANIYEVNLIFSDN
jgi:hypothetical protein